MSHAPRTPRLPALLVLAASAALFTGCVSKPKAPDRNAPPVEKVSTGAIRMASGVDLDRVRLLDQARKTKVYAEMVGIGDASNEKLLFPASIAQKINITPRQMARRFMDTVAAGRRFEVYDSSSTVTAEASDIVIDGMVTGTLQDVVPIEGGLRVAVTRVRLSLQMKDRYTGKLMFPAPVVVEGQTGRSTGDRTVLAPSDRLDNPAVQERLGQDYAKAMQRAFDDAAKRIDAVLRPLGRVLSVDGDQIGMVGGSTHGLQGGDEMVVFRATTARLGGTEVIASTRPLVVVRCDGVGTLTSQCTVIRRDTTAPQPPQAGDYAVLTDRAASGVRVD